MIDLKDYLTKEFEVTCNNGFVGSSVNGKPVHTDSRGSILLIESDRVINTHKKIKALNRQTKETYYTPVYTASPGHVEFTVVMANHLNKKGLNWEIVYSASLSLSNYKLNETGEKNLNYWLEKDLEEHLLLPKNGQPEPHGTELEKTVKVPGFLTTFGTNITIREIFKAYGTGDDFLSQFDLRHLVFGVEIEFTGMTREVAAKYIAKTLGGTYYKMSISYYDRYAIQDKMGRLWYIKRDSSIRDTVNYYNEPAGELNQCELETPILHYKDIETLQKLVRGLRNDRYMKVNSSCGIHVHVGGISNPVALKNVYNLVASHQKLLKKALDIKPGRLSNYCCMITGDAYRRCSNETLTMNNIRDRWDEYEDASRYRFVNFNSFFNNKGIEFRCFNSTTHAGVLKSYIQLCLAICNYAERTENVRPDEKELGHDLTKMRNWLHKLGLTGDEYKTCRYHLTKNLSDTKTCINSTPHINAVSTEVRIHHIA